MKLFQNSLCNVMSHVVFACPIKLNISTKNSYKNFYKRSYIVISSDLCNAIKKILDKISCHRDRYFTVSIEIGQNTVIKILQKKLYCDFK